MVRLESATADAAMARAIADSRLRQLPPQLLGELLTGSERDRIVMLEPDLLNELSKWNPGH
ncbi:hypothetical protein [Arthrobacter crystallopoietes]|uniref:hypothetical protein n=1 Tax=Crystallibacter crystallopoietes TaxID=37928 RepID=UPI00111122B0|nr:hypothetical protein [Arthrobacter crystallopoietes]QTG80765.1 hypothetical protein J5251_18470 [Arthrobacter crystallopoietes]